MAAPKLIPQLKVFLVVKEDDALIFEKSFEHFPIVIGRSTNCEVPLSQYSWISRQHVRLVFEKGEIWAEDLGSANGMTIEGVAHKKVRVGDGTVINLTNLTIMIGVLHPEIPQMNDPDQTMYVVKAQPQSEEKTEITETQHTPPQSHHQPPPLAVPLEPLQTMSTLDIRTKVSIPSTAVPEARKTPSLPVNEIEIASEESNSAMGIVQFDHTEITDPSIATKYETQTGGNHRGGLLGPSFVGGLEFLALQSPVPYSGRLARHKRVLEAYVTWKGQIIDSKLCRVGGSLAMGPGRESLYVPFLMHDFEVGSYDGNFGVCYWSEKIHGYVFSENGQKTDLQRLVRSGTANKRGRSYHMKLGPTDVCQLDMGFDVQVYLRYAPAPRQLTRKRISEPDELLQKAGLASGLIHLLFLLMVVFVGPQPHTLKVKNLPARVAKLIVQKPKPPPPPPKPPEEKKPEPKLAEKKPEPKKEIPKKIPPKPKQVIVKTNAQLKKINKLPVEVKQPVVQKVPEKKVEELGALAALGALGAPTPNPKNQPVAINVNRNAGGAQSMSTSGVIGALKAKGGQLAAGGMPGVKTKGHGYGTGTGYGVQGLQGRAGARGVQGSVVGTPTLMKISRTEGLSQKEVMDVVKKYVGKIQQCYERALLSEPGLAGRIEYEWSIDSKGKVTAASVKRSDMHGADTLNECVLGIFRDMKFPASKNGEGTTPSIGFPFGRL